MLWPLQRYKRHRSTTPACSVAEEEVAVAADADVDVPEVDDRIPVTVITGFLGSGKTTLLNHVLTSEHGKKIAVIENEFGEVDIDGSLVAAKQTGAEDILMLNNGCLCCTVRGDLVRMLSELVRTRRGTFDHVIIETTGLANPAPIIQTFFLEDELAEVVRLDGVVTLVDARHAERHLDAARPAGVVNEALEQIAYADRVVLNKVDLVSDDELEGLARRVKNINSLARQQRTQYGRVDLDFVLGLGGFDLDRVEKDIVPQQASGSANAHGHHEHGGHSHEQHKDGHGGHGHEECGTCGGDHATAEHGAAAHDHQHREHEHGQTHSHGHGHIHDHVHDERIKSVSIVKEGDLDLEKVNDWLGNLLAERSEDLYRMKGVLSIRHCNERFVFQGVHALFEGTPERPWGAEETRTSRLVFIGKDLDAAELREGFDSCLV